MATARQLNLKFGDVVETVAEKSLASIGLTEEQAM